MLDALGYRNVTIDRHSFWVHPVTGRVLPDVRGGSDIPPAPPTPPAPGTPPAEPPAPPATLTQEDADRIAGRARDEGRRAAARELADTLGVSVDDAKKIIADHAAKVEADKDEITKAQEAAATAQRERDEAVAAAARTAAESKMGTALLGIEGFQSKYLADALRLVDVDPADDDDAVKVKAEALKERMPALFAAATGDPPAPPKVLAPPPPGTPPAPGAETDYERGKRLASTQPHLRSA